MSKILYLCDPAYDFSSVWPQSKMITSADHTLSGNQFYTSIYDISTEVLLREAINFDEILIWEPGFDKRSTVYKDTKTLHSFLTKHNKPINPQTKFISNILDHDRDDNGLLWVFGCSHSAGVGLIPGQFTYGKLLSDYISLPLRLVAQSGSSLHWSIRHLFAAAVKPQDTVIWQITSPGRMTRFDGDRVNELVLANSTDRSLIDSLSDWQTYFDHFTLINFGVKYLRSIGCNFAMISMMGKRSDHDLQYLSGYITYQEYCPVTDIFIDHGTDGLHPGPNTHKNLALRLIDHLQ